MVLLRLFCVLLFITGLAGCATMDKSECLNADWAMIGMEDGAKGRPASRIGEHRKACADYGITPDLEQYRTGHATGLQQFCTAGNGYQLGKRGGQYGAVCPPEFEADFLSGYHAGRQLYTTDRDIKQMNKALEDRKSELQQLRDDIEVKEQKLISDRTPQAARRRLLEELRDDEAYTKELEDEIFELELLKTDLKFDYDALKRSTPY